MSNYKIYVGCNVQDGRDWELDEAVDIIISICKAKGIEAMSISDCKGVYTYNNGQTVHENTVVLTLVNYEGDVKALVMALKVALRQECIMLEKLASTFDFI